MQFCGNSFQSGYQWPQAQGCQMHGSQMHMNRPTSIQHCQCQHLYQRHPPAMHYNLGSPSSNCFCCQSHQIKHQCHQNGQDRPMYCSFNQLQQNQCINGGCVPPEACQSSFCQQPNSQSQTDLNLHPNTNSLHASFLQKPNGPVPFPSSRGNGSQDESGRTKAIKEVARRVSHLERKRYRDEREALKRKIKHLKIKQKSSQTKRATSLDQDIQIRQTKVNSRAANNDGRASHYISVNHGLRAESEPESLVQQQSVSPVRKGASLHQTPGSAFYPVDLAENNFQNQQLLLRQIPLQRQANSQVNLQINRPDSNPNFIMSQSFQQDPDHLNQDLRTYFDKNGMADNLVSHQNGQLYQNQIWYPQPTILIDQFGQQYIVNEDPNVSQFRQNHFGANTVDYQSGVQNNNSDKLDEHSQQVNKSSHLNGNTHLVKGSTQLNDRFENISGKAPNSEARSQIKNQYSLTKDSTMLHSSINQTSLSQLPMSIQTKRLSSKQGSIPNNPNYIQTSQQIHPQKILYDPSQFVLNQNGLLESKPVHSCFNDPVAAESQKKSIDNPIQTHQNNRMTIQQAEQMQKDSLNQIYNSFDERGCMVHMGPPIAKNTMESTAISGSTNQLQSFGHVLQNSSIVFASANCGELSTLQQTYGVLAPIAASSPRQNQYQFNHQMQAPDNNSQMLLVNQFEVGSPQSTMVPISKKSTIQGVDFQENARGQPSHAQSIYFANPETMLTNKQLVLIQHEEAASNKDLQVDSDKFEPTILSETLNQRACTHLQDQIQAGHSRVNQNYENVISTPSISEIQKKQAVDLQQNLQVHTLANQAHQQINADMNYDCQTEEIELNLTSMQKPPLQAQALQSNKNAMFKMKELRKKSDSKQTRKRKHSTRKKSRSKEAKSNSLQLNQARQVAKIGSNSAESARDNCNDVKDKPINNCQNTNRKSEVSVDKSEQLGKQSTQTQDSDSPEKVLRVAVVAKGDKHHYLNYYEQQTVNGSMLLNHRQNQHSSSESVNGTYRVQTLQEQFQMQMNSQEEPMVTVAADSQGTQDRIVINGDGNLGEKHVVVQVKESSSQTARNTQEQPGQSNTDHQLTSTSHCHQSLQQSVQLTNLLNQQHAKHTNLNELSQTNQNIIHSNIILTDSQLHLGTLNSNVALTNSINQQNINENRSVTTEYEPTIQNIVGRSQPDQMNDYLHKMGLANEVSTDEIYSIPAEGNQTSEASKSLKFLNTQKQLLNQQSDPTCERNLPQNIVIDHNPAEFQALNSEATNQIFTQTEQTQLNKQEQDCIDHLQKQFAILNINQSHSKQMENNSNKQYQTYQSTEVNQQNNKVQPIEPIQEPDVNSRIALSNNQQSQKQTLTSYQSRSPPNNDDHSELDRQNHEISNDICGEESAQASISSAAESKKGSLSHNQSVRISHRPSNDNTICNVSDQRSLIRQQVNVFKSSFDRNQADHFPNEAVTNLNQCSNNLPVRTLETSANQLKSSQTPIRDNTSSDQRQSIDVTNPKQLINHLQNNNFTAQKYNQITSFGPVAQGKSFDDSLQIKFSEVDPQQTLPISHKMGLPQDYIDICSSLNLQKTGSQIYLLQKHNLTSSNKQESNKNLDQASQNSVQGFNQSPQDNQITQQHRLQPSMVANDYGEHSSIKQSKQLSLADDKFGTQLTKIDQFADPISEQAQLLQARKSAHFAQESNLQIIQDKENICAETGHSDRYDVQKLQSKGDQVNDKKNLPISYSISTEDYIREQSFQRSMKSIDQSVQEVQQTSKPMSQLSGQLVTANDIDGVSVHSIGKSSTDRLLCSANTNQPRQQNYVLAQIENQNYNGDQSCPLSVEIENSFSGNITSNLESETTKIDHQTTGLQTRFEGFQLVQEQTQEIIFQNTLKKPEGEALNNNNNTSQITNQTTPKELTMKLKTDPSIVSNIRRLKEAGCEDTGPVNQRLQQPGSDPACTPLSELTDQQFTSEQPNLQTFNANDCDQSSTQVNSNLKNKGKGHSHHQQIETKTISIELKKNNQSVENNFGSIDQAVLNNCSSQSISNTFNNGTNVFKTEGASTQYLQHHDSKIHQEKSQSNSSVYQGSNQTNQHSVDSEKSEPRIKTVQSSNQLHHVQNRTNDHSDVMREQVHINSHQQQLDQNPRKYNQEFAEVNNYHLMNCQHHCNQQQFCASQTTNRNTDKAQNGLQPATHLNGQTQLETQPIQNTQVSLQSSQICLESYKLKQKLAARMRSSSRDQNTTHAQNLNHQFYSLDNQPISRSSSQFYTMNQQQEEVDLRNQKIKDQLAFQDNECQIMQRHLDIQLAETNDQFDQAQNHNQIRSSFENQVQSQQVFMMDSTMQGFTPQDTERHSNMTLSNLGQSVNLEESKARNQYQDNQTQISKNEPKLMERSAKSKRTKQPSQKTHESSIDAITFKQHNSSETNQRRQAFVNHAQHLEGPSAESIQVIPQDHSVQFQQSKPEQIDYTQLTSSNPVMSSQQSQKPMRQDEGKAANQICNQQVQIGDQDQNKQTEYLKYDITSNHFNIYGNDAQLPNQKRIQQSNSSASYNHDISNNIRDNFVPIQQEQPECQSKLQKASQDQFKGLTHKNGIKNAQYSYRSSSHHSSQGRDPFQLKKSVVSAVDPNLKYSFREMMSIPEYPEISNGLFGPMQPIESLNEKQGPKVDACDQFNSTNNVERGFLLAYNQLQSDMQLKSQARQPKSHSILTNSVSLEHEPSYYDPAVIQLEHKIADEEKAYNYQYRQQSSTQQMLTPINVSCTQSNAYTNRESLSSVHIPSLAMTQSQHYLSAQNQSDIDAQALRAKQQNLQVYQAYQSKTNSDAFLQIQENQIRGRNNSIDNQKDQLQENLADACNPNRQVITKETFSGGQSRQVQSSREILNNQVSGRLRQVALKGHIIDAKSSYMSQPASKYLLTPSESQAMNIDKSRDEIASHNIQIQTNQLVASHQSNKQISLMDHQLKQDIQIKIVNSDPHSIQQTIQNQHPDLSVVQESTQKNCDTNSLVQTHQENTQPLNDEKCTTSKSVTQTTDKHAFSAHFAKDSCTQVFDQTSSQFTRQQLGQQFSEHNNAKCASIDASSQNVPSAVGLNFKVRYQKSEQSNIQNENLKSNSIKSGTKQMNQESQNDSGNVSKPADQLNSSSQINFENIMVGFDEDAKQTKPEFNNKHPLVNQNMKPAQFSKHYDKERTEETISNIEKSMQSLSQRIQRKIGPVSQYQLSNNNHAPQSYDLINQNTKFDKIMHQAIGNPIDLDQFGQTTDFQIANRNKEVQLDLIGCQHERDNMNQIDSETQLNKSQTNFSQKSMDKVQSGLDNYWTHVSKDLGAVINGTSSISENNNPNYENQQQTYSNIQLQTSALGNLSVTRETEQHNAGDLDGFRQMIDKRIQEFLKSKQPLLDEQANKIKQIISGKPCIGAKLGGSVEARDGVDGQTSKSCVSLLSSSKVSMDQILESNRSLIRQMQHHNHQTSAHFSNTSPQHHT